MCRICVRRAPRGRIPRGRAPPPDKAWRVAVVDHVDGRVHPVTLELIGKARELAAKADQPVYALFIGENVAGSARELLHYGVDRVFVYDAPALARFRIEPYANVFEDFVKAERPAAIVRATPSGGSSPRVAARLHAGLTADCTVLDMLETPTSSNPPRLRRQHHGADRHPNHRPQMATVRW
ncbi:MAG: electron transfer flavoprotein subunit alpha/FixB family protein [Anaerotruncus massiliensis (ex Togo et al. 2019)]